MPLHNPPTHGQANDQVAQLILSLQLFWWQAASETLEPDGAVPSTSREVVPARTSSEAVIKHISDAEPVCLLSIF
jgi:hypothetical protein